MEEKEGVIKDLANRILTDSDGMDRDFVNPAQVTIKNGDGVIYIEIITPNKVIRVIKDVK